MKLINIDKVVPTTEKVIVLGGVQYGIQPISVGAFIKATKDAEEYVKAGVNDPLKEVEMVVELIQKCIPSAPRYALDLLTIDQLKMISDYIQKGDVDGAEDVEGNV